MKKTSVYLDPDKDAALGRRAAREGVSKAELLRRAVDELVADERRPLPSFGAMTGGPKDLARNVDRYLAETGLGEWR